MLGERLSSGAMGLRVLESDVRFGGHFEQQLVQLPERPRRELRSGCTTKATYTPMFNFLSIFPPITLNSEARMRFSIP